MAKVLLIFLLGSAFGAALSSDFILNRLKQKDKAYPATVFVHPNSGEELTADCPEIQSQVNYAIQEKLQKIVLPQIETTIQQEIAKLSSSAFSHTSNIKKTKEDKEKIQEQREYAEQILSTIEVLGFIDQNAQDSFDIAISKLPAEEKYQLDLELARKINSGQITLED